MKKLFKSKNNESVEKIIVRDMPTSSIAERYRTVRVNIDLNLNGGQIKTLMVTSAKKLEGKTTTVSNLAVSFAQQGKKVLLVNADLRNPKVEAGYQIDKQEGLSNLLTRNKILEDVIKKTDVENLWLLPSGSVASHPSDLLSSQIMKDLIRELSANFELILFDCPPILEFSDAKVIGTLCDAFVLVVKNNKTEKDHLTMAKVLLERTHVKLLGLVITHVSRKEIDAYGF